jgi:septum site-determining protein MinC
MSTNTNPVEIKGQKEGLWIFLDDQVSIEELFSALEQKLSSSNNFFAGAEVTINSGKRTFSPDDVKQLHDIVENKHSLHIRGIEEFALQEAKEPGESEQAPILADEQHDEEDRSATSGDSFEKAEIDDDFMKALDETFRIPIRQRRYQQETDPLGHLYENDEKTFYFRGTVRSGQTLEFPGNIVIVGDVNPGAYVVASGDIIVMGRLNGVVHAGAEGEEDAVVIGAGFFPSQLRIAQYIGRPPDEYPQSTPDRAQTEKASIKDGTIVIEPIL